MHEASSRIVAGYYFKQWREHVGYTQRQLAEIMGVTKTTISRIERGARGFSIGFLEEFHEVIGTPAVGTVLNEPPQAGANHRNHDFKSYEIERIRNARAAIREEKIKARAAEIDAKLQQATDSNER